MSVECDQEVKCDEGKKAHVCEDTSRKLLPSSWSRGAVYGVINMPVQHMQGMYGIIDICRGCMARHTQPEALTALPTLNH